MNIRTMALVACMVAQPAFASCTQSDLQGQWDAYSTAAVNGASYWVKCALTVEASGTIATGSSSCVASNAEKTGITGSIKLKSASLCTYKGSITLEAIGEKDTISEITLDRSHDSAAGVGISPENGFAFTIVRD